MSHESPHFLQLNIMLTLPESGAGEMPLYMDNKKWKFVFA